MEERREGEREKGRERGREGGRGGGREGGRERGEEGRERRDEVREGGRRGEGESDHISQVLHSTPLSYLQGHIYYQLQLTQYWEVLICEAQLSNLVRQ